MIRVLIADDHPIIREGLKRIIEEAEGLEVLAEAASGDDAVGLCRDQSPDVLVLDINMPGSHFLETMRTMRTEHEDIPVLVLSVHPEEEYALRSLRAGAAGYLTKDRSPEELAEAVRTVHEGRRYVTARVAQLLAEEIGSAGKGAPHESLSEREYEILRLLAAGKTVTGIANDLELSPKTVSTYRTRVLQKMQLKSTGDLIRYAVQHGLVN